MPGRQRVVIDTSVFISGLLTPSGTSQKDLLAAADVEAFLDRLVQRVEFFVPTVFQSRSRDLKDDKFLDLAQTVGAAFLTTGDKDLLSLATSHGVPGLQLVQPADFLRHSSE